VGNVKKTKKELINQGILVRDCTSFGLPSHIRFSVRRDDENELLINALLGFTSVSEQRQHLKK
jgi:histidinol-phosphate aminotransferase